MTLSDIIDLGKNMGAVLGLAFYIAIVIWTYKDARKRTEDPILVSSFTAISMLPLFGVLIYMLVRPSEYIADVRERELEIRALERQLGRQERCPYCKSHIEGDYLSCPVCTTKLRQSCTGCEKPLDPRWVMCPFCETEVPNKGGRGPAGPGSGARRSAPTSSRETETRSSRSETPARERAPRESTSRSSSASRAADKPARTTDKPARASEKPARAAADKPARSSDGIKTEPFGSGDATRT